MSTFYKDTITICPHCAADCNAHYEFAQGLVWLKIFCHEHGEIKELVENDIEFFKWGYEQPYDKEHNHLVIPLTYKCNIDCKFCYSMSNENGNLPPDRSGKEIIDFMSNFNGSIMLSGGEPTVRKDIFDLVAKGRELSNVEKISIATNAQKLADINYVKELMRAGLEFVFFSFNDIQYDGAAVYEKKMIALENCVKLRLPIWLNRVISNLCQIDSLLAHLEEYRKGIFKMTIRSAKPFGNKYPDDQICLSDVVKYLNKEDHLTKGRTPFNRHTNVMGIRTKLCSWSNDAKIIDPIDVAYLISDNRILPFHKGMKYDELILKKGLKILQKS